MSQNQKKIILFFNKRRIIGLPKNDEFAEYVQVMHNKYFHKQKEAVRILKNHRDLSRIERNLLWRNCVILAQANYNGYIGVNWDAFFALSSQEITKTAKEAYEMIKERFPEIIETWNIEEKDIKPEYDASRNREK